MNTELQGVSSRYAEAVIELAEQQGPEAADLVLAELHAINQVMGSDRDTTVIINHPSIPPEQKKAFLNSLFGGKLSDVSDRLINLLADKRRLDILPFIESNYQRLLNERKNVVSADLVCSEQLADDSIANIKAQLTEHLGKKLDLNVSVDQSLIGGVVLKLGDQVIDGSLRGRLNQIEKTLLAV